MNGNIINKEEIENYSNYIVSSIRAEDTSNSIENKINLLAEIYSNKEKILSSHIFYEEECMFSIINWIWNQRKNFTKEDFEFLKINDLVYNSLMIFETFPLQFDFYSAKLFSQKLINIGKLIKNINSAFYGRIKELVSYWENQFSLMEKSFIRKKRERFENQESELELELEFSDETCYSKRTSKNDNENIFSFMSQMDDRNNKKVTWKENLVDVIPFDPNEAIKDEEI